MLTPLVLVVLAAQTPNPPLQPPRLQQTSFAPDPVKPEQNWPPVGVFRAGGAVTQPKLIKETQPSYLAGAMRMNVQGTVVMEAIVLTDGTVGAVHVVRSLDKEHGLDEEAVKTVREWRFTPGKKDDAAVPVVVEVRMAFKLRK